VPCAAIAPAHRPGEMAEWLKAHAWKACVPQGTVGSNPTLSAIDSKRLLPAISKFGPIRASDVKSRPGSRNVSAASSAMQRRPCAPFHIGCTASGVNRGADAPNYLSASLQARSATITVANGNGMMLGLYGLS
jgi:hypothetical protein